MLKSYIVDSTCENMRVDRWIRNTIGSIPQGLIEKSLRSGKIKVNKKKIKSSHKIKSNDKIDFLSSELTLKSLMKPSFLSISAILLLKLDEGNSTFL